MIIILLFILSLGLAIGSFLNALMYRMEKGESVLKGRSYCPHCNHTLSWKDLIPLASFFLLAGKCRYCKKPISWQYPAVEIASGSVFLLIFNFALFDRATQLDGWVEFFQLLYLLTIASLLIVIFVYDLKYYLIPDRIIYSAIGVSGIWYFVSGIFFDVYTTYEILNTLYSSIGALAFFLAIFLVSKGRWLGFGDVKLAFLMGLVLGWPKILVSLFVAFSLGALVGLVLIALQKKTMKSEVPFGPFLVFGTFVGLFWGDELVTWYIRFLSGML